MHTTFSPDGHATMAQQLDAAERVGLSGVCLTDHLDLKHQEPICDVPVDYDRWFAELDALRAQHPRPHRARRHRGRRTGLRDRRNAGRRPGASVRLRTAEPAHDRRRGPVLLRRVLNGRTPEAAFRRYAECVWESINRFDDFDCLAHLGYCSKFAPREAGVRPFDREYAPDVVDAILKKARPGRQGAGDQHVGPQKRRLRPDTRPRHSAPLHRAGRRVRYAGQRRALRGVRRL